MKKSYPIFLTNKKRQDLVSVCFWYKNHHVTTGVKLRCTECLGCGIWTYTIPYCHKCLQKYTKLCIAPSNIKVAGLGIFAGIRSDKDNKKVLFRKGDVVCGYGDENNRVSWATVTSRYGTISTQPYTYETTREVCYDSSDYRTIGSMINDALNTEYKYNVCFVQKSGTIMVKATRNIFEGQELYIEYGESYWSEIDSCKYYTGTKQPDWYDI
jgi:hypothetical protein